MIDVPVMFDGVKAAIGRYTGYTRFISPVWNWYVEWIAEHPKTSGALLLALFVLAVF